MRDNHLPQTRSLSTYAKTALIGFLLSAFSFQLLAQAPRVNFSYHAPQVQPADFAGMTNAGFYYSTANTSNGLGVVLSGRLEASNVSSIVTTYRVLTNAATLYTNATWVTTNTVIVTNLTTTNWTFLQTNAALGGSNLVSVLSNYVTFTTNLNVVTTNLNFVTTNYTGLTNTLTAIVTNFAVTTNRGYITLASNIAAILPTRSIIPVAIVSNLPLGAMSRTVWARLLYIDQSNGTHTLLQRAVASGRIVFSRGGTEVASLPYKSGAGAPLAREPNNAAMLWPTLFDEVGPESLRSMSNAELNGSNLTSSREPATRLLTIEIDINATASAQQLVGWTVLTDCDTVAFTIDTLDVPRYSVTDIMPFLNPTETAPYFNALIPFLAVLSQPK